MPSETVGAGSSAEELAQLERDVAAALPEPPPPPPPPDAPAAGAGADGDLGEELEQKAERLAAHPEDLDGLAELDAEDLADVCQLGFGLVADRRGPHWELSDKSAARLGKWLKRVIDKHGLGWLKAWLPEVMVGLLLGFELQTRLREDRRLAGKTEVLAQAKAA